MWTVVHDQTDDNGEANDRAAALVAARTLLEDNDGAGSCRVTDPAGNVVAIVWPNGRQWEGSRP